MKKLILLFSLLLLGGCTKAEANEKLVIGMDETFAPMGFLDDDNNVVGFDVDLAKETFERLGYEIEFQAIDWSMKETELNTKNIDMIWNGYAITPEREEKVLMSEPYLDDSQMIVVRKDSDIEKKSDLEGKILSTQQSSSSIDKIMNDPSGIYEKLGEELVLYPTNNNSFLDLEAGRVDAIVVGESYGRYYIKESDKDEMFRILEDDFGQDFVAVAFRKEDTAIKDKVDETLAEMKKDGTYDTIYQKWFFTE